MINETAIRARYEAIKDQLDERGRRLFVAAEKIAAGYGGTAAVSRATGVAHSTIIRGAKDLLTVPDVTERVRRKGAGRPALSQSNPTVLEDLRRLVEPATMGDPMRPLLWVSKSLQQLASALRTLNHAVSANTVGQDAGNPRVFPPGQSQDQRGQPPPRPRRAIPPALKPIYQAPTADAALLALDAFEAGPWGQKYAAIAPLWRRQWDQVIPFFAFPPEVRRIIYTTNAIESLNSTLRTAVRSRGRFPTDEAAIKLLYLILRRVSNNWKNAQREWTAAMTQFAIMFGDRFSVE
jgi:hypothetical protein